MLASARTVVAPCAGSEIVGILPITAPQGIKGRRFESSDFEVLEFLSRLRHQGLEPFFTTQVLEQGVVLR